ncbi:MAG: NapC/NirT family cytochrome c [Candidatus Tectomicrobia bacterium]|nr:NapC/NirT family cytochrome c [Candidatus Tectomicrobia bacterium]
MGQRWVFLTVVLLAALLGATVGTGAYVFVYAKGASYLTNDPAACANCHIMSEQYSGWLASSHRAVAVCNDCHTPPGLAAKYQTKPIQINAKNLDVTEQACRNCHQEIVEAITHGQVEGPPMGCVRCHGTVGHLR